MQTFAQALHADYFVDIENLDTPRHSPSTLSLASTNQLNAFPTQPSRQSSFINGAIKSPRIRKVSALSDFAPVNVRVKKRKRGTKHHEKRTDWLFMLVRWPLLVSNADLYPMNYPLIRYNRASCSYSFSLSSECTSLWGNVWMRRSGLQLVGSSFTPSISRLTSLWISREGP